MGRGGWIILVVLGIAGAILLGVWAVSKEDSQANAESSFCSSLESLESNVQALTDLNPTSSSKDDYESAVDDIESSWDDVKSDASNLVSVDMSTLDSAWDSFKSAVDDVPDDASVSDALNDVKAAAQSLASTVQSTLTGPDCSSS